MSTWQERKAEINRRALARLTKALPAIFPAIVQSRALAAALHSTDTTLGNQFVLARASVARRPARPRACGTQRPARELDVATRQSTDRVCQYRFAHRPRLTAKRRTHAAPGFAACAVSPFISSAGTLISGTRDQTSARPGIAPASSPGNSGTRRANKHRSCGVCRHAAAARPAAGFGRTPKSTIASRCIVCGANTATQRGRSCSTIGASPICKSSIAKLTSSNAPTKPAIAAKSVR